MLHLFTVFFKGLIRAAQSSTDISTAAAMDRISPPKEDGKSLITSMVKKIFSIYLIIWKIL